MGKPEFIPTYTDRVVERQSGNSRSNKITMRIFHININGISTANQYSEWEIFNTMVYEIQADVFGVSEMNLDLQNKHVKRKIIQIGKAQDRNQILGTSASRQKFETNSHFKMGGTVTGVSGK